MPNIGFAGEAINAFAVVETSYSWTTLRSEGFVPEHIELWGQADHLNCCGEGN